MPLLAVPQAGWPSLRGHRARTSDIEIDGAANMTWYSALLMPSAASVRPADLISFGSSRLKITLGYWLPRLMNRAAFEWQNTSSSTTKVITTKSPMACRDSPATIGHYRQSRCGHPGPGSAHNASTRPASAAGSISESTPRSQPRAAAILSATPMPTPITRPLGASRSWPWQASSTSH
jgi:hypothetical protein